MLISNSSTEGSGFFSIFFFHLLAALLTRMNCWKEASVMIVFLQWKTVNVLAQKKRNFYL